MKVRFVVNKLIIIFILFSISQNIFAELKDRVLVVYNSNSQISKSIANYYQLKRNVVNSLAINCNDASISSNNENIYYVDYLSLIENPIKKYLENHPEIDFIVLTKGIPIRLVNAPNGPWGGLLSVDSYLSGINYNISNKTQIVKISDINYGAEFKGEVFVNRFWNSNDRFTHSKFGGYLVTRLDGYTEEDIKALINRAISSEITLDSIGKKGIILLDECPVYGQVNIKDVPYSVLKGHSEKDTLVITSESAYGSFNTDLELAYSELTNRNIQVNLETTELFTSTPPNLMGYCSWGSNDAKYNQLTYNSLSFSSGAIGETAVSTSARTFLPTTGGQSLVADLIHQGITGMKGYVNEPLLQAIASPSILFDRYTKGWTLAESFYAASNFLRWQDIIIGDPIARAYPEVFNSVENDTKSEIELNVVLNKIALEDEKALISIFTIDGKLIKNTKIQEFLINCEFDNLQNGIYFLNIKSKSKNYIYKILK